MTGETKIVIVDEEIRLKMHYRVSRESFLLLARELKTIGDHRFDRDNRQWVFPATTKHAQRIRSVTTGWHNVIWDDAFNDLLVEEVVTARGRVDERPPPLVKTTPWAHQARGYRLIERQTGTMLNHDMGTGKTKTTIDAIINLNLHRTLIACPKSVLDVWVHEFKKHSARPVMVTVLRGSTRKRVEELRKAYGDGSNGQAVIITNYAAFTYDAFEEACQVQWDLIVADESHKIKAPRGKTSLALWRIAKLAKRRLGLTGTLMPHSPLDVFAQYRFLDETIFGRYLGRFKLQYTIQGGFEDKQIIGWRNQDELHEKIFSIADRVMKRDVIDLPAVVHERRVVEVGDEARRVYSELMDDLVADIKGGVITASNALTRLLRLQQVTSGFGCVAVDQWSEKKIVEIDDAKRCELKEIFEAIDREEPIVVFCRFVHDLKVVSEVAMTAKRASYELSGRINELDVWKGCSGGPVLAVQIQAGGVGIDLTKAAYAVYYSLGFSLGDYEQSLARLDRPGQSRSVTYLHLIASDTVDERVYGALRNKAEVVNAVLEKLAT